MGTRSGLPDGRFQADLAILPTDSSDGGFGFGCVQACSLVVAVAPPLGMPLELIGGPGEGKSGLKPEKEDDIQLGMEFEDSWHWAASRGCYCKDIWPRQVWEMCPGPWLRACELGCLLGIKVVNLCFIAAPLPHDLGMTKGLHLRLGLCSICGQYDAKS